MFGSFGSALSGKRSSQTAVNVPDKISPNSTPAPPPAPLQPQQQNINQELGKDEELEGHKLRMKEHERRMLDTLKAEEERRRGRDLKKIAFDIALNRARGEEAAKAKKREKDAANKADKLKRMEIKKKEYVNMLKGRDVEIELMAAEEAYMIQHLKNLQVARLKAIELLNLEKDAITQAKWEADQAESARRLQEMSERKLMAKEEQLSLLAWKELARQLAELDRQRREEAEQLAAQKWKDLVALVKPHKIHQDANFKSLRSTLLANMDAISESSEADLREVSDNIILSLLEFTHLHLCKYIDAAF
jgi:hypothetical protein